MPQFSARFAGAAQRLRAAVLMGGRRPSLVVVVLVFLFIGFVYFSRAITWPHLSDNDPAYYFGVAKYMASTGRLEEPIIWHFLLDYESVFHPPFDYWPGGVSIVLVPFFWLLGPTKAASGIMASLFGFASTIVFFRLMSSRISEKLLPITLMATWLFAFSPALAVYRFEPEGVVPFQFFLLLALLCLFQGRLQTALIASFCGLFFRGDGLLFFLLVLALCFFQNAFSLQPNERKTARLIGLTCVLVAGYLVFNLIVTHALMPPAARLSFRLADYSQLYCFGDPELLSNVEAIKRIVTWDFMANRITAVNQAFDVLVPFLNHRGLFGLLSVCGIFFVVRKQWSAAALVLFVVGYSYALAFAQPVVFAWWRTLHILIPVIYLIGGIFVGSVVRILGAKERRLVLGQLVLVGLFLASPGFSEVYSLQRPPFTDLEERLRALDAIVHDTVIASDRPWWVIANTSNASVQIPGNGEQALRKAIEDFGITHILTTGYLSPGSQTTEFLDQLKQRENVHLGRFTIRVIRRDGDLILAEVVPRVEKSTKLIQ